MAEKKDRPFDPAASDRENEDDFDQLTMEFHDHVEEFAEQHDLPDALMSLLALKESLVTRMFHYVVSVEKPSASGLKLELDRFRREVDEIVQLARKDAEEFVANAREAIAEADKPPDRS
jgi:hypothetical protein